MSGFVRTAAFLIALFVTAHVHAASERVALVIGNGAYEHAVALPNPRNDADDLARLLQGLDFEVIKGIDLTRAGMEETIRDFAIASAEAKTVLFFYAGHGMQVGGRNYLIPVDAKLLDKTALDFETLDAEKIFQYMSGGDKTALVFLDACRNNPLARSFARALGPSRSAGVGRGLAAGSTAGSGLFVAFATAPDDVAQDGEGRNSPFTAALLRHLAAPATEIQQVMTRVKADVQKATGGKQRPWHNSDLSAEVYLAPGERPVIASDEPAISETADELFWKAVENATAAEPIKLFLERFPRSRFARQAEQKLAALSPGEDADTAGRDGKRETARRCDDLTAALRYELRDFGPTAGRIRPEDIVTACRKAVDVNPGDGDSLLNLTLALYNVGDSRAYEETLIAAAASGNLEAQVRLGSAYLHGNHLNIQKNRGKGEELLLKAAEAGSWSAASSLHTLYKHGGRRFEDKQKEALWYDRYVDALKKQAGEGDTEARQRLGTAYMSGEGIRLPADPAAARSLLETVVAEGNVWALNSLGWWYTQTGPGFAKDQQKSVEYYREYERALTRFFEAGNQYVLLSIAGVYHYTDEMKDQNKALEIYKKAIEIGLNEAYESIGGMYFWDDSEGLPYNRKLAIEWYVRHVDATGRCTYFPYHETEQLHSASSILGNPESAARCVLESLVRNHDKVWSVYENDYRKIARPTRIEMQRLLRDEGFYQGPLDGKFGSGTFAALNAYLESF